MKTSITLAFTIVALCAALHPAYAEEPKAHGVIAVSVTDRNGVAVKDASVKAVRIGDNRLTEGKSGADGACKLDLEIGTYCFTVRAPSFAPDFTGGVNVHAKSESNIVFMLNPGDPNTKLPFEKTPADRAAELAKTQQKLNDQATEEARKAAEALNADYAKSLQATYEGLDATCKALGIERKGGGPAKRNAAVRAALDLAGKQKYEEALDKYREAVGEDASDPLSWFNMGVLFGALRQAKNSELCYRTAIGLCGGGGEADYHAYLGQALGAQGRFADAEKEYKSAIALEPKNEGQYLYELGCAYHAMQMFDKSAPLFAKAIDKHCDEVAVYFAYGNALEMTGKKEDAAKAYETFLKFGADDPSLQQYVQKAKAKLEALGAKAK
ncbi:MAG: tetratricopeptide repeat protein [Planctomycetes bacterium]|nr:tetratricopeptide repeat protein [Planctomycetota bacterium]